MFTGRITHPPELKCLRASLARDLKGSAYCRRPRIFGFFDFSENVDFWNFPVGFGVWGGLQSMGKGCGIQIDGFSVQTEPYGSIFDDCHDFDNFSVVFGGLMLSPEGPRTLRECPEVPGPYESVLSDWSQLVRTSRNSSLVATSPTSRHWSQLVTGRN